MGQIDECCGGWKLTCCSGLLNDVHTRPVNHKEMSSIKERGTLAEEGSVRVSPCGSRSRGHCGGVRDNGPFFAEEWGDSLLPPWSRSLRA